MKNPVAVGAGMRRAASAVQSARRVRALLVACVAVAAATGCAEEEGGKPDRPFLEVRSEGIVDELRVTVVATVEGERVVVSPDTEGGEGLAVANLGGQDLRSDPYFIRLDFPSSYPDEVSVHVQGRRGGKAVSAWAGAVATRVQKSEVVWLHALVAGCDADGDGYSACALGPHCCADDFPVEWSDCDDSTAEVYPARAQVPTCVPCGRTWEYSCDGHVTSCQDGDSNGCADCAEGVEAPGVVELCNGADDDCDGETDEVFGLDAACPPAPTPACYTWQRVCDASMVASTCVLVEVDEQLPCSVTSSDPCLSGPGVCARPEGGGSLECQFTPLICPPKLGCAGYACSEGTCERVVDDGWCAIDDACHRDGEANPQQPCEVCDADADSEAWSVKSAGASCDDGNLCTAGDTCAAGGCVGSAIVLSDPVSAGGCDDDNPCTLAIGCDSALGCQYSLTDGAPCGDNDPCTSDGACDSGQCVGLVPVDCDDGLSCTVDGCISGQGCQNTPVGALCDDGIACTDDACVPGIGCTHVSNESACSDGDACTTGDQCSEGACVAMGTLDCDDQNPCTESECDSQQGCVVAAVEEPTPCDDGSVCTEGDMCAGTVCHAGDVMDCDDGNPCTVDGCDAEDGCTHTLALGPCNDGDPCTVGDTCPPGGGACTGQASPCDDGNACTTDSCNPATGACAYSPTTAACNDGNACTQADACSQGVCKGAALDCSDGKLCTNDTCNTATGCVHTNNALPCDDGNACTMNDVCSGGSCTAGPINNCNDGNGCTTDSCSPATGQCSFVANANSCSDGTVCTSNDTCTGGQCKGLAINCDDGKICTTDSCDSVTGCQHPSNTVPCNDGNACTANDVCALGVCAGSAVVCSDGNVCTTDSCEVATGCKFTNNSVACDDGNPCTDLDTCVTGSCKGSPKVCTDAIVCTVDYCSVALAGCVHLPIHALCDDGNLMTVDTCVPDVGCTNTLP